MNPEAVRLINQEMDGANSAEESRALSALLAESEESRRYARELREAMEHLRRARMPEPGPDFKAKILAFLPRSAYPEKAFPGKKRFPAALFEPLKLKYALFFCLGLGLGVILLAALKFRVIDPSGWDTRQLAGTVVDIDKLDSLDTAGWEAAGISQKLDFLRGEGMLAVGLRGNTTGEVAVTLAFPPDGMRFDSVRRISGEQGGVEILPGKLILRTSGPHGFLVLFQISGNPPVSLDIRAESSGETLFSRSYTWPKNE